MHVKIIYAVGKTVRQDGQHCCLLCSAHNSRHVWLLCAGAMGLPVSGFPNMNAVALEDSTGHNYIGTMDFIKVGVPGSILTYGIIVSFGYVLAMLVGF